MHSTINLCGLQYRSASFLYDTLVINFGKNFYSKQLGKKHSMISPFGENRLVLLMSTNMILHLPAAPRERPEGGADVFSTGAG